MSERNAPAGSSGDEEEDGRDCPEPVASESMERLTPANCGGKCVVTVGGHAGKWPWRRVAEDQRDGMDGAVSIREWAGGESRHGTSENRIGQAEPRFSGVMERKQNCN